MDAQILKQVLAKYWTKKRWAVAFETGIVRKGRLRADVLITSMGSQIIICETKSSVADFKADKKWHQYLRYCDKFYFVMDATTYAKVKELIPAKVGVFVVDDSMKIRIVRKSSTNSVKPEVRLNVITRMAYKSADVVRGKRVSKTAGAKYVASVAVDALYSTGRFPSEHLAKAVVAKAIQPYV